MPRCLTFTLALLFTAAARPEPPAKPVGIDFDAAKKHWAYQPLRQPALPVLRTPHSEFRTPIDAFIRAKLHEAGLAPSPPAEKRTLLRRVTYDLIGLPPTPAEVDAFLNDKSPDAFAKVVDRLLASPHYGERWGRHWLDVARYADTKDGVLMYGDDRVRPYAYTYRDYVIRAFNEDLPYDRFVHEQLAADLIEPKVEPWRLAAMGFLTLGRMFDNNIHDVIDDRIDTVTRGLLGLTVACARCHDHKYDPIPQADYYSLYGVFASAEAPLELPPLEPLDSKPGYVEFEKQAAPKRRELQKFLDEQYALLAEDARKRVGDYLVHVVTTQPDPLETAIFFLSLAPEDLRPPIIARWRRFIEERARASDPVFGPWHKLMKLPDGAFAKQAHAMVEATAARSGNPLVLEALKKAELKSKADVARAYGNLLRRVYDESKKSPPTDAPRRELLAIVASPDSPSYFPKSHTWKYMSRKEKDGFGGKLNELDRMAVKSPNAPPRAMALVEAAERYEPCIFVRGNPTQHGEKVSRQFLRILDDKRQPFPHGSGRLDLARAITAPENPLAARVMVNRVWMHHFGEPLVSTPSDFGSRSTPPTHPELLDYLAWTFSHDLGWSLKKLHRLIVLSDTYQQSSAIADENVAAASSRRTAAGSRRYENPQSIDADNKLLWRMNRRRLDLESMRDTLLGVSGRLDPRLGGRPVDVANDAKCRRRTVYGLVDRQSLPGVFRAFDFASPDQSTERRPRTIVPQQALFALNSPFVLEAARSLAARPEVTSARSDVQRIFTLYRLVYGRAPSADETLSALHFVHAPAGSKLTPWEQYAQVLLLTNEVMFVD